MEQIELIKAKIKDATMVLLGIGTEVSLKNYSKEELLEFFKSVAELIKGKFYFAVTLNTDDLIYEAGLEEVLIVAPCGSDKTGNVVTNENYDESGYLPQWQAYQKWLGNTLNQKFVILELGVGLEYPSVLRFPDEKMAYYNQKATLIRIHSTLAQLPSEISDRSISRTEHPIVWMNATKNSL